MTKEKRICPKEIRKQKMTDNEVILLAILVL